MVVVKNSLNPKEQKLILIYKIRIKLRQEDKYLLTSNRYQQGNLDKKENLSGIEGDVIIHSEVYSDQDRNNKHPTARQYEMYAGEGHIQESGT